ncbi:hypothetical protein PS6_007078 [Mucor atramentarius]
MNNWENNRYLSANVTSSPCANSMSTPEAYYSPNQNQIEMFQQPEYWYQTQQRGISPSSSSLSREDSYSPCSTPMFNLDDPHIMNPPLSSSCSSQFMPLIDPMVYSNNSNHAPAVASTSQSISAYQQPMMMPLLEQETQAHHEKLLSHYNAHEPMMANSTTTTTTTTSTTTDMNTYMTYSLRSATSPILSNMYSMNAPNNMPANSMYVSYHNNYINQQLVYADNHATTAIHHSLPTSSTQHAYEQQQSTYSYPPQTNHLMATSTKESNTHVPSSSASSSSYSSSSSNIIHGTTSIMRHKQNSNNNNNNTHAQNGFPCLMPECNKLFSRPYNLKSHMRTHTHERPYEYTNYNTRAKNHTAVASVTVDLREVMLSNATGK